MNDECGVRSLAVVVRLGCVGSGVFGAGQRPFGDRGVAWAVLAEDAANEEQPIDSERDRLQRDSGEHLLDIGRRLGIALSRVHAVGDSIRDVDAALAAGCRPVLVRTGYGREAEQELGARREQVAVYNDLAAFAAALIATA